MRERGGRGRQCSGTRVGRPPTSFRACGSQLPTQAAQRAPRLRGRAPGQHAGQRGTGRAGTRPLSALQSLWSTSGPRRSPSGAAVHAHLGPRDGDRDSGCHGQGAGAKMERPSPPPNTHSCTHRHTHSHTCTYMHAFTHRHTFTHTSHTHRHIHTHTHSHT